MCWCLYVFILPFGCLLLLKKYSPSLGVYILCFCGFWRSMWWKKCVCCWDDFCLSLCGGGGVVRDVLRSVEAVPGSGEHEEGLLSVPVHQSLQGESAGARPQPPTQPAGTADVCSRATVEHTCIHRKQAVSLKHKGLTSLCCRRKCMQRAFLMHFLCIYCFRWSRKT